MASGKLDRLYRRLRKQFPEQTTVPREFQAEIKAVLQAVKEFLQHQALEMVTNAQKVADNLHQQLQGIWREDRGRTHRCPPCVPFDRSLNTEDGV